jgi:lysophospholipase L1-like esterase
LGIALAHKPSGLKASTMRAVLAFATIVSILFAAMASSAVPVGQGENGDWANVGRYHDANRPLIAKPDPRRLIFIGDSITEGWTSQPFIKSNQHFIGRGISGQTTPQMLVRFRSDVIALKPSVVHIMGGTNDIARNTGPETIDEILGYITSMTELARASGIRVVLGSLPPASDFPWHHGLQPASKISALNARLRAYAARHGIAYADYWRVLATPDGGMKPQYSEDGVHLNAAGYDAIRPVAEAAIAKARRGR